MENRPLKIGLILGKVIENENDNKSELIIQANEFMSGKFDILKELKIV